MSINSSAIIHPTAIVDNGASIGANCKIWHWTHICKGAIIKEDTSLGQNVYIANKVIIGKNVKIQNNVSVYDNVTIEDNVFCGPSMVFTNVINPRSEINRKNDYLNTLIQEGASLGANCTIICGNKIGRYAFVGAGSVVTKDVKDYSLMVGVPSIQIGWISEYGDRIKLPFSGDGEWVCPKTKDKYILIGSQLYNSSREAIK